MRVSEYFVAYRDGGGTLTDIIVVPPVGEGGTTEAVRQELDYARREIASLRERIRRGWEEVAILRRRVEELEKCQ